MSLGSRGARLALLLVVLGVGAGAATAAVRHAAAPLQLKTTDKVVLCHATGNGGYVQLDIPVKQVIDENGHAHHPDDIIPPFDYEGGSFPGLNWPAGKPTWENGCVAPPAPQPIGLSVACSAISPDGQTYDATFGYNSPNAKDVTIPIGDANSVQPGGPGQGQPQTFRHGSVWPAFTVHGIPVGASVTWSVTYGGQTTTAPSTDAGCDKPPPIEPHVAISVSCAPTGASTFEAIFSYSNPSQTTANVPIDPANNVVTPSEFNGRQPQIFYTGDHEAFRVTFTTGSVTWTLVSAGSPEHASISATSCGGTPGPKPVDVFVECVTNHDSTYDATFGYANPNTDPVHVPIGENNSVSPGGTVVGQPDTFAPDVTESAFTVTNIPQNTSVTWTLNSAPPAPPSQATASADNHNKCNQPPQVAKIGIFVRCVTNNGSTFDATFGYQSDNLDTVTIPVGPANRFSPAPEGRGQTTDFQPGNVQEAFTVKNIPSAQNLVWTLTSNGTRTSTASANYETKCSDPPPDAKPIGVFVTCIDNHGSTYDATFGYQNDNDVAETIEIGPANGFSPEPVDRGQPVIFMPGRTTQAVVVHGIPASTSLTWTVAYDGTREAVATAAPPSTATANPSSPACSTPPTPPNPNPEPPNPTPPDPPGPKPPEPPRVIGIFPACVVNNGATYDAVFGYVNLNVGDVVIPIGPHNYVRPGADDQGQPETFAPGFVAAAFVVRNVPVRHTVTWTLKFGDETRVATAGATFYRKCVTAPIDPYPDLKITKKPNPNVMYVGHRVVFTITVTNIGHRAMSPLVITDRRIDDRVEVLSTTSTIGACRVSASASQSVSACGRGELAPGESAVVRVVGRAVRAGRAVDRAAALFRPSLDPTPKNNFAHASVLIKERSHPKPKPPFTG